MMKANGLEQSVITFVVASALSVVCALPVHGVCAQIFWQTQTPNPSGYAAIKDFLRKNNLPKPE